MALKDNDHDIEQSTTFQPVLPKPVFVFYYVVVLPNSSGRYSRLQKPRVKLLCRQSNNSCSLVLLGPRMEYGGQGWYCILRMETDLKNIPEDSSKRDL